MATDAGTPPRPEQPSRFELAAARLLELCTEHFPEPDFEVETAQSSIVWVKHPQSGRSVGLQPWLLREYSEEEVLQRAEKKLGLHG